MTQQPVLSIHNVTISPSFTLLVALCPCAHCVGTKRCLLEVKGSVKGVISLRIWIVFFGGGGMFSGETNNPANRVTDTVAATYKQTEDNWKGGLLKELWEVDHEWERRRPVRKMEIALNSQLSAFFWDPLSHTDRPLSSTLFWVHSITHTGNSCYDSQFVSCQWVTK